MVILSININAADFKESKMKCDNNIAKGCHSLGYIYYFQMNNKAEGRKAYKKACSLKNKNSCLALGNISHREGKGKEEEKYLQKACDIGSDLGCQLLGNIYLEQKRHQEAKPLLEKGCNSSTLEENIKQEACRDLKEIANTVVKVIQLDLASCIMRYKFSPEIMDRECSKVAGTKESSALSEKNQKAMDDCVSNLPAGSLFAQDTCALKLGLKIDVTNELLPKLNW